MALEALRLFVPDVHHALARVAAPLTRSATFDFLRGRGESDKTAVEGLIQVAEPDHAPIARAAIRWLFPAAERHLSNTTYAEDERHLWRKERWVAALPGLLNYLTKVVGENAVGAATTSEAAKVLGLPEAFAALTDELTTRQLEDLLRRLTDYDDEVDPASIPAAVAALFQPAATAHGGAAHAVRPIA